MAKATEFRGFNLAWGALFLFHAVEHDHARYDLFQSVQIETRDGELHEGAITSISLTKLELDYSTVIDFSKIKRISE